MLTKFNDALGSALLKLEQDFIKPGASLALAPRENRLPDYQGERLKQAVSRGWNCNPISNGEWTAGEYGFEGMVIVDYDYQPTSLFSPEERAAVVQELIRPAAKNARKEYFAILAAHKRYTGGDGLAFVLADLIESTAIYSEMAIRNAMDYFKFSDDSPWFPSAHDILDQIQREQRRIDKIANTLKTGKAA